STQSTLPLPHALRSGATSFTSIGDSDTVGTVGPGETEDDDDNNAKKSRQAPKDRTNKRKRKVAVSLISPAPSFFNPICHHTTFPPILSFFSSSSSSPSFTH